MIKKLILTILLFSAGIIYSQSSPDLISDRPYFTDSPIAIPPNHFQIETGFVYEKQRFIDNNTTTEIENLTLGSTLCRYGIDNSLEFRFGGEYLIGKTTVQGIPTNVEGI